MPRTIQTPLPPMELNSPERTRRAPAKADLRRQSTSTNAHPDPAAGLAGPLAQSRSADLNLDQCALTAAVKDVLIDACGSLKSAAISMVMDSGQLTRDLQDEGPRIGKLGKLPAHERAEVFDRLHEQFGSPAEDPKAQLRREIRELRAKAEAVAQLAEKIA